MLKALMKKELAQLGRIYLFDSRKKKKRSPAASAGIALILLIAFASIGMLFFGMAEALFGSMHEAGLDWLYFAFFGLISIAVGVIGSVFSTNQILYKAKDNELLLSMPIPPSKLLFVRILTVFVMSLIGCVLVWVPVMIRYDAAVGAPFATVMLQLLLLFAQTLLVTVLSCLLGWLVGLISERIANKTAATVVLTVAFLTAYYVAYFKLSDIIKSLIANLGSVSDSFSRWGWPLKQMGLGATGKAIPAILFTLACIALFVITYAVLSATLVRIMTATGKVKRSVYRGGSERQADHRSALLGKELGRFTGSAIYLLNGGMGALIMIAMAVFAVIKADVIREFTGSVLAQALPAGLFPIIAVCAICLVCGMDCISASSVSLEGKTLWQIRSMPVEASEALAAKLKLHVLINAIPGVILAVVLGVILKAGVLATVLMAAAVCCFVWLTGALGLVLNLKRPMLDWTNEAIPVKQGTPVLFSLLFGFLICLILFGLGALLVSALGRELTLAVLTLLMAAAALLLTRWIMRSGARIFEELD